MIKKGIRYIGIILIFISILTTFFTITRIKKFERQNNINIEYKNNNYFLLLEIPKISLKQELYNIKTSENDVNKNIYVHPKSDFTSNNSNIILAAHSGYGSTAFFKNLYKLSINDTIYLYYNNKKYEYYINEIENQEKTGHLLLKKINSPSITLITCTKNSKTEQTIYYGILKSVNNL